MGLQFASLFSMEVATNEYYARWGQLLVPIGCPQLAGPVGSAG
jgi:hypothetical protein